VTLASLRLSNASLKHATLADCDLEGATIDGILISDLIQAYQNSRES
jgi:uncharacterized protein YjbI with pentapeptide repeats